MKITKKWLKENHVWKEIIEWFENQKEKETGGIKIIKKLKKEKELTWAIQLILQMLKSKQCVSFSIFAAELVLPIFEKQYPEDVRPRKVIELAKECIIGLTELDISNAAVYASVYAKEVENLSDFISSKADELDRHAIASATALIAVVFAAEGAVYFAGSGYSLTQICAIGAYGWAVSAASYDYKNPLITEKQFQLKILNYGIKLLEKKK